MGYKQVGTQANGSGGSALTPLLGPGGDHPRVPLQGEPPGLISPHAFRPRCPTTARPSNGVKEEDHLHEGDRRHVSRRP
eukprot:10197430-Alexandrium_andersonii.AAC.1